MQQTTIKIPKNLLHNPYQSLRRGGFSHPLSTERAAKAAPTEPVMQQAPKGNTV